MNNGSLNKGTVFSNAHPDLQLYWNKESQKIKLTEEQFRDKLKELINLGYRRSVGSKTMLKDWPLGSMRLDESLFKLQLFVRQFDGQLVWYYYTSNKKISDKRGYGGNAKKVFTEWLREHNFDSVYKIYGGSDITVKRCVPKSFYYIDPLRNDLLLHHMNCIDACSQYPSGFLGKMPDGSTAIPPIKGTVKPTEEYPFAFYASGHLAIYNEFDTHDWLKSEFADVLCPINEKPNKDSMSIEHHYRIKPENDYTMLMKAAKVNPFEQFFREQYEIKENYNKDTEDYEKAKLVLNSLIGCMHYKDFFYRKSNWHFAHLAAVAIARGNNKVLKLAEKIGKDNIAMIVVDSIIYQGTSKFGDDKKSLGKFHQEVYDCDYMQRQISTYAFMKDGETVKFKHAAQNVDDRGKPIEAPKEFYEMYNWRREIIKDKQGE